MGGNDGWKKVFEAERNICLLNLDRCALKSWRARAASEKLETRCKGKND
jgi:Skp family chaperone for outer membrane proteins